VIDPVEQGHVCTRDEVVCHEHSAHDYQAEPGGGH
jgi:hypothetical protein